MAIDPHEPGDAVLAFLREYHLATLTTLRPDGSPHVVAVGFSFDADAAIARVITFPYSVKARNVAASPGGRAAVCQVDGGRYLTLEGPATVTNDPEHVAAGVAGYTARYRAPKDRPDRVVIEIAVDRILGRG